MHRAQLAAALIASLGGCTAAKSAVDAGHCPLPSQLTQANFGEAFATASVCQSVGCSPIADGILPKTLLTPVVRGEAASVVAALASGSLTVDYANAGPCLAAFADGCRAQSLKLPSECRGVLVPAQPQGGTCYTNLDCSTGYCIDLSYAGCPGTCSLNDGGCTQPTDCGQFQTCVSGQCVEGAPAGSGCASDSDCQVGLGCVTGSCSAPGSSGAACALDAHCAPDFFCALSGDAGVCAATHGVGNACSVHETSLSCGYGNYCEAASATAATCVAYGKTGDACSEFDAALGVPTCEAGLVCADAGCGEPPSAGPCEILIGVPEACLVSNYCDAKNTCAPYQPDGQSCDPQDTLAFGCSSGVCGDAGTCVPPGAFCPVLAGD